MNTQYHTTLDRAARLMVNDRRETTFNVICCMMLAAHNSAMEGQATGIEHHEFILQVFADIVWC